MSLFLSRKAFQSNFQKHFTNPIFRNSNLLATAIQSTTLTCQRQDLFQLKRRLSTSYKIEVPSNNMLPKPPLSFKDLYEQESKSNSNSGENDNTVSKYFRSIAAFSLPSIVEQLSNKEDKLDSIYKIGKRIDRQMSRCRAAIDSYKAVEADMNNDMKDPVKEAINELVSMLYEALSIVPNSIIDGENVGDKTISIVENTNAPRAANLGSKLEATIRLFALYHFLKTGKLITLKESNEQMEMACEVEKSTQSFNFRDEEYVGGIIGFAQDLADYGIGRATVQDRNSVSIARDLVSELLCCLLKFDFRNGPIRRKFDGMKYALKRLENTLYELAVVNVEEALEGLSTKLDSDIDIDPSILNRSNKRLKIDGISESMAHVSELEMYDIKTRMDKRDELRETVIKRTRDSQKAAKQAIYALHRGDNKRANKLIIECEKVTAELLPIIEQEPQLRYGSFSNSLEEYAEAQLFKLWLSEFRIGSPEDLPLCNEDEYLGGLCDLTGEIGRVAVAKGTKRDVDGVRLALITNMAIRTALENLSLSKNISKKIGPLHNSIRKLEQILYELSLMRGGRTSAPSGGMMNEEVKENDNDQ